jgi:PAS domain S-box-containing protein
VVHWSQGAVRVLGHEVPEALDRHLAHLILPHAERDPTHDIGSTTRAYGEARAELLVQHRDGAFLYVDFVTRRLDGDASGHVLWVGRDDTQSRLLRTSVLLQARYGELLESTPDGMLLVGETGHILLANSNAERLFGYGHDELQGRPIDLLMPQGLNPGPPTGQFVRPRVPSAAVEGELLGRRKSGEEFPVEVTLSPLRTDEGRVVINAVRDVTERVNAARTFRELLEAAPDAMVIVDATGTIVLANSQTDAVFGYAREELIGQPVELLLPERYRGHHVRHRREFDSQPRRRAMGAGLELYARQKDGLEFPVEISLSPIRTADGTLTSAAIRDISERKAVERRLQEQNVRLEQASAAKTNFLAGMSHELRTPLNAIIGFTGTLLMKLPGPLNAEQEKQLRTVQWAGQHLLTLINDLLDLTRIESGETRIEFADVPAVTVAREAVTQLRAQAEAKGLELVTRLPDDEIVLRADRRALGQILMNLLANAVKYTDAGRVRLAVTRATPWVRFEVADTGIGIRPVDRERLFKAFSRLDRGNETRQGTGLGLYLSARLAALLGGRIEFDSVVGTGSTFTLILPEN